MTSDRFLDLAPLAALGALDGEDLAEFRAHLPACAACRGELESHEAVSARIGLLAGIAEPSPHLRSRVLGGVSPIRAPAARRPSSAALATAAAVVLGVSFLIARSEQERARREAESLRQELSAQVAQGRTARERVAALEERLAEEKAVRDLLAHPESRTTALAGLPAAPRASGRVIWNPASREAVLIASGLDPAPEGKGYEVWVIAGGSSAPAGVFQVDAQGKAVFHLPKVETARVKAFAVTLESEGGVPAPTGPMVLLGGAS